MLVKTKTQNLKGQEIFMNALTGKKGILADHSRDFSPSERSSRRTAIYVTPVDGTVHNNRKRTKGRKIYIRLKLFRLKFKKQK